MAYYHGDSGNSYNGRAVDKPIDYSQYTAVTLDPEFDLDLSGSGSRKPALTGTIHTFPKKRNKVYGKLQHAVRPMLNIRNARRTLVLLLLNIIVLSVMLMWSSSSNSLSLRAYTYITAFDLLTLLTYLISLWFTAHERNNSSASNGIHLFNQERVEILLVFASVILSCLGAIFILKESILRIIEQPDVAIGRLIPGSILGLAFHLLITFSIKNKPLQCVAEASTSSIIQEHVSDLSQPICSLIPFLKRILHPRVDPFFLLSAVGACLLLLTDLLIQIDLYFSADTAASFLLAFCTLNTMWPIAVCSAKVLLNTTPPYVLAQLDKLLSEAQTLDGVLEIRNERFHAISLSSKSNTDLRSHSSFGLMLVGSMVVRVRRDANEQLVLAHVTNRLSPLVSQLTVQIVKDGWTASAMAPPGVASNLKSPVGSTIIYGFNKPAAAVAPYQQTPPKKASVHASASDNGLKPDSTPPATTKRDIADDFSFTVSQTPSKIKSPSYSTPALNIARMYKAAGYTSPPSTSKRVPNSSNLLSK